LRGSTHSGSTVTGAYKIRGEPGLHPWLHPWKTYEVNSIKMDQSRLFTDLLFSFLSFSALQQGLIVWQVERVDA